MGPSLHLGGFFWQGWGLTNIRSEDRETDVDLCSDSGIRLYVLVSL